MAQQSELTDHYLAANWWAHFTDSNAMIRAC